MNQSRPYRRLIPATSSAEIHKLTVDGKEDKVATLESLGGGPAGRNWVEARDWLPLRAEYFQLGIKS